MDLGRRGDEASEPEPRKRSSRLSYKISSSKRRHHERSEADDGESSRHRREDWTEAKREHHRRHKSDRHKHRSSRRHADDAPRDRSRSRSRSPVRRRTDGEPQPPGREDWDAKLADLAAEDFSHLDDGWERFQSSYEQELAYEQARMEAEAAARPSYADPHGGGYAAYDEEPLAGPSVPRRYMDKLGNTGADFLKRGGMDMDDEQYAEYVREGMWRRANASYIREQDERAEREAARRAEKEARDRKRREKQKRREREAEAARKEQEMRELREARAKWDARWEELRKPEAAATTEPLWFSSLPWPCLSMWNGDLKPDLTREAIAHFLLAPDGSEADGARARLRSALLRYHPDRFLSAPWFARVPEASGLRDKVRECVQQVAGILNDLQAEQREKAQ